MPTGTIAPAPKHQYLDENGDPYAGAQLFTYEAGTSTKLATYTDVNLSSANTNPIVLDAAGRATIFLSPTSYKFILAPSDDTDPPTSPIWTVDNVSAVPGSTVDIDVTATAGEALSAGDVAYLSAGDGSRTAGRWYKADADLDYASTTANALGVVVADIASGSTGTVRIAGRVTGLSGLSIGSVYYVSGTAGALTATAPALKRPVGIADSITTLILSQWLADESPTLSVISATVGNVGSGEDDLSSYELPAGKVAATGQSITGVFWGKTANNANVKTLRIRAIEGANNNVLVSLAPTVSEAGHWLAGFKVIRTGATTARCGAQALSGPVNGPTTKSGNNTSQPTLTWANAITFKVTGDATSDNDVTIEGGALTFHRAT